MGGDQSSAGLPLEQAAALLGLPVDTVAALADRGYLDAAKATSSGPRFALSDLKAFLARNADNGAGNAVARQAVGVDSDSIGRTDLLDALDARTAELAERVLTIFTAVHTEARDWSVGQRERFVAQAKGRFEAILAITAQGSDVDEALADDLEAVGASAAWAGSSLSQLLLVLRISRDLLVHSALELAGPEAGSAALDLPLMLSRLLPAMDRLTDSITRGYWSGLVSGQQEALDRYRHLADSIGFGMYEVDLDGKVVHANVALTAITGHGGDLIGMALNDVLRVDASGGSVAALLTDPGSAPRRVWLTLSRPDGARRSVQVVASARRQDGDVVGFCGVVRDVSVEAELVAERGVRAAALAGTVAAALRPGTEAAVLASLEELRALAGGPILSLEAGLRPVPLHPLLEKVVAASHRGTSAGPSVLRLDDSSLTEPHIVIPVSVVPGSPTGVVVVADADLLFQVMEELVGNAGRHGAEPVQLDVELRLAGRPEAVLTVSDRGSGVPDDRLGHLFGLPTTADIDTEAGGRELGTAQPGECTGLILARRLVDAMGGRIWYERTQGCSRFRVALPAVSGAE
jgi:PAS domain S-box-containing protein